MFIWGFADTFGAHT